MLTIPYRQIEKKMGVRNMTSNYYYYDPWLSFIEQHDLILKRETTNGHIMFVSCMIDGKMLKGKKSPFKFFIKSFLPFATFLRNVSHAFCDSDIVVKRNNYENDVNHLIQPHGKKLTLTIKRLLTSSKDRDVLILTYPNFTCRIWCNKNAFVEIRSLQEEVIRSLT